MIAAHWDASKQSYVMTAGGLPIGSVTLTDDEADTGPQIPPEVHNKRPIDPDECMAAVRAMSRAA